MVLEKGLAERLNQDGDFEADLKVLGNPPLGWRGHSKCKGAWCV